MVVILYLLITYQYSMASNTGCVPAESSDIREAQYIGLVYNSISADFSRTRYKVWPCVSRFLDQIINESTTPSFLVGETTPSFLVGETTPSFLVGETTPSFLVGETTPSFLVGETTPSFLVGETTPSFFVGETTPSFLVGEIGCGNGKNLAYLSGNNDRIKTIGVDISSELLNICRLQGLEVVLGSILNIPLNDHTLDYTLSVAVIHHLRDRADRIRALRELARVTRLGGRCLITVWARVQNEGDGKRRFATNDEMVPFKTKTGETHYRFYHLYDDGELADDLAHVPEFRVANLFIERGNYIAELVRVKQQFKPN